MIYTYVLVNITEIKCVHIHLSFVLKEIVNFLRSFKLHLKYCIQCL